MKERGFERGEKLEYGYCIKRGVRLVQKAKGGHGQGTITTTTILGKFYQIFFSSFFGPSLTKGKGWDGVTRYAPT